MLTTQTAGGTLTPTALRNRTRSFAAARALGDPHSRREVRMSEMPEGLPEHPIGTFAFVTTYAVLFVLGWFAIYFLIFLARQPITP
jgi:hypothetical protein